MNKKRLAELIHRRRTGQASAEDIAELERFWLEAQQKSTLPEDHSEVELERIGRHMFDQIKSAVMQDQPVAIPLWKNPILVRAAAVLLVMVSVSVWFYRNQNEMMEVHTAFGERLSVVLPDQSSVVLNGNSVLRYAPEWNADVTREVWIEGEGFFSVMHTQSHAKFIVHAERMNVEVLGTKFNVKARASVSEVMLAEGQVKLGLNENSKEEVFLKPGEVASISNQQLRKRPAKKEYFTAWVEDKLFFDRTKLGEVAQMLQETYGLQVRFQDPGLKDRELSGEISSATEDDILLAITETFDLTFVKEGRSVVISEK